MEFDDEYAFDLDAAIEEEQMIEEEEMDAFEDAGLVDRDDGEELDKRKSPVSVQKYKLTHAESPGPIHYRSSP
jgi:hypothetical protein